LMEVEKTLKAIRLVIRSSHDSTRTKKFVVLIEKERERERERESEREEKKKKQSRK